MSRTIGERIKFYRNVNGFTQKELGVLCGFSEATADVRIAQYEKNLKIPRNDILLKIAKSLSIEPIYLQLGYLSDYTEQEIIQFITNEIQSKNNIIDLKIRKLENEKIKIDEELSELYKQENLHK